MRSSFSSIFTSFDFVATAISLMRSVRAVSSILRSPNDSSLSPLSTLQVAQHLGDLEDRAGLDLLHVLAVAAVPRLALDRDLAALEDREHLVDLVGADQLAQTDRAGVASSGS